MKTILRSIAALAVIGSLAGVPVFVAPVSVAVARSAPDSFADLAERLSPAVVNISTSQFLNRPDGDGTRDFSDELREFFERRGQQGEPGDGNRPPRTRPSSLGSGFIIDKAGYIVTNNHVIEDADQISVILDDDTVLEATVIGRDDKVDIALLKVEAERDLPTVPWGNSDAARVGDWVMAIGNPFGLSGTVTAGIISARARDISAGSYDDFLQTDASINRGNSGGPLFNMSGQVVGVNTAIFSPSGASAGVGFAASSNLVRPIIDDLRKFGRARRGWIGVRIQTVTDEIAQTLGLGKARGALVADVTPGGPAVGSGILSQDVILRFDGKPIDKLGELPRVVAATAIDKSVDVVVWRDGKQVSLKLTVGELTDENEKLALSPAPGAPVPSVARTELADLGLTVVEINEETRESYGVPASVRGLVVIAVDETSDAALKGLRPGDVIDGIQQANVLTVTEANEAIAKAKEEDRNIVLLRIVSDGTIRYVPVKMAG